MPPEEWRAYDATRCIRCPARAEWYYLTVRHHLLGFCEEHYDVDEKAMATAHMLASNFIDQRGKFTAQELRRALRREGIADPDKTVRRFEYCFTRNWSRKKPADTIKSPNE